MRTKSTGDAYLPKWKDLDAFSVLDFLAEGPEYFAGEPFTIHIAQRSGDINEFLNLQLQLRTARYHSLSRKIRQQIKEDLKQAPRSSKDERDEPAETPVAKTQQSESRLLFSHQGRQFEISYSPEQYAAYFDLNRNLPDEVPRPKTAPAREEDVFDRFLKDPHFFQRSASPEAVSPDESIEESVTEDETIVTETLARIHLRQGNQEEAVKIYRKLGLLFPEKSAYFEAQIKKIEANEPLL
jgi:hypothetical protein